MENICDKMKDFVRARLKSNGQLVVIPLFSQAGQMNSMISDVDIIQDSDLNKSLQFYVSFISISLKYTLYNKRSKILFFILLRLTSGAKKITEFERNSKAFFFFKLN